MKKQLTLCMVFRDNQILLGMKKRGFGEGRWNGFGGKLEEGESVESAAMRELWEEVGIKTDKLDKAGIMEFTFQSDPDKILEVHIFKINDFTGEPEESEEMKPQWFKFSEIPFHQMWSDDEQWFPFLLLGKLFKGKFHFDRPSDSLYSAKIITQDLFEVDEI